MTARTSRVSLAVLAASIGVATAQTPTTESPEMKRGRILYIQCRACHDLKAGPQKVGPNLFGIVDRKAASAPDFNYSAALQASGLTWDRVTLDRWLEKPGALVPGNTMAFAGIANPKDRAALLNYVAAESRPTK
jgi:cytochrome c